MMSSLSGCMTYFGDVIVDLCEMGYVCYINGIWHVKSSVWW